MNDPQMLELEQKLKTEFNDPQKGREYRHMLSPDEIEYYACAFELIFGADEQQKYFFSFPLMPQGIQETKTSLTGIMKTLGGVVITTPQTFTPFDINLNGNFGRKLKRVSIDNSGFATGSKADKNGVISATRSLGDVEVVGSSNNKRELFSSDYKTGYGCIKILERILIESQKPDMNGKPQKLLFYNMSLNSNYMVEVISFTINQNRDLNMIWSYNIVLKAVAPATAVFSQSKTSLSNLTSYARKNLRMSEQSTAIKNMLCEGNSNAETPVAAVVNKANKGKIQQAVESKYGQAVAKSAYNILTTYTVHAIENNDFLASLGKNIILNHIPRIQ